MTSCEATRRRLTAYLEGELSPDDGTLVRGHLRGCAACRQVASAEAALRDGLRALPQLDPPPSLWAGVQAQLAAAEQAEAARPGWRRAITRWAPRLPGLAAGGLLAAAAVTLVWWRAGGSGEASPEAPLVTQRPATPVHDHPPPILAPEHGAPDPGSGSTAAAPPARAAGCNAPAAADVTADLALDATRLEACYAAAADELIALAGEARPGWTDAQRAAFDARIAELRGAAAAAPGRPRQRALRALIRYVETALARDEIVAIAAGGAP